MNGKKLGERIRGFREVQELTREELSRRTGLTTEFLAALEEEDVTPSLGPLLKISRALGLRLGTFMDDDLGRDFALTRKADLTDEDVVMRKARGKRADFRYHSLGAGKSDRHMEPFFIEIYPDESNEKNLSSHEGEEFITVASGELELVLGRESYLLGPGDSVYFNSVVPHYVGCGNAEKTEIHAVLYFPQ